jgi:hypothetical protein
MADKLWTTFSVLVVPQQSSDIIICRQRVVSSIGNSIVMHINYLDRYIKNKYLLPPLMCLQSQPEYRVPGKDTAALWII